MHRPGKDPKKRPSAKAREVKVAEAGVASAKSAYEQLMERHGLGGKSKPN